MKKLLITILLFAAPAFSQSGQPRFQVQTLAAAFRGAGQTLAGTDAIGTWEVSPHFYVRNDNFLFPSAGLTYDTAGMQYQRAPQDFFKSPTTADSASKWQLAINAGIGATTAPSPSHFAGNFGGSLKYDLKSDGTFGFTALQVEGLVGRFTLPATTASAAANGQVALSISAGIHFSIPGL